MKLKYLLSTLALLVLSGCGDNPLLGTWKAKSGQNQAFFMCKEIIFTKELSKCGSMVEDVSYDVEDNFVIVSSDLGDKIGIKAAYEIIDKNTMAIEIPMSGRILYGRSSY